jgi:hypothetical protein
MLLNSTDIIAEGTNSDIDTAEEDIVSVTDLKYTHFSQLSMYVTVDLGTHTTVDLRLYYRGEIGGTWMEIPKQNESSNTVESYYWRFDSGSPTPVVLDIPISSAFAFKITGQGVGGANADVTVRLLARNN